MLHESVFWDALGRIWARKPTSTEVHRPKCKEEEPHLRSAREISLLLSGKKGEKGMHCEAIQLEADLLEYDCLLGLYGASWPVFWIERKIYKRTWDLPEVGDQTCKFKTSAIWLRWPK